MLGRNEITRGVYEKLVEAYRAFPGKIGTVSRMAGVDWRTAKRAWEFGWPNRSPRGDWPPIKLTIAEEQRGARANSQIDREAMETELRATRTIVEERIFKEMRERDAARADAVQSRADEAKLVRAERGSAIAAVSLVGRLFRGMLARGEKLEAMVKEGKDEAGQTMTIDQEIKIWSAVYLMAQRVIAMSGQVVQQERLLLGQPTEIIGVSTDGMTIEDAIRRAREANEMANRMEARAKRRLTVLQGGLMTVNGIPIQAGA